MGAVGITLLGSSCMSKSIVGASGSDYALTGGTPQVSSLEYTDDGSSVAWSAPVGQTAQYELQFCRDAEYADCLPSRVLSCSGTSCALQGDGGTLAQSTDTAGIHFQVTGALQSGSQTYAIRVRAFVTPTIVSRWAQTSQCTYSVPAQCTTG